MDNTLKTITDKTLGYRNVGFGSKKSHEVLPLFLAKREGGKICINILEYAHLRDADSDRVIYVRGKDIRDTGIVAYLDGIPVMVVSMDKPEESIDFGYGRAVHGARPVFM